MHIRNPRFRTKGIQPTTLRSAVYCVGTEEMNSEQAQEMSLSNVLYSESSLLSPAPSISLSPAGGILHTVTPVFVWPPVYRQPHSIPPKSPSPNPFPASQPHSFFHALPYSRLRRTYCKTREDEIGDSWKAIVFLCFEEALWAFKRKNDRSNAASPLSVLFCSAVQLDSCGAQDSGHPEHQDRALRCHEQRGLPLHFGTVSTCGTVMPKSLHNNT